MAQVISLAESTHVEVGQYRHAACYVDDHVVIIDKPAGMLTHADGTGALGCAELLGERFGKLLVVHRLDRETSGVLVLARTSAVAAWLTRQFEQRLVQKLYHFVTTQESRDQRLEVRTYIDKVRGRLVSKPPVGKWQDKVNSHTVLEFEKKLPADRFLWRARPTTGKTHQIRLHAKAAGISIVGDSPKTSYRVDSAGNETERLFLHASELTLVLQPEHGETTIRAPMPKSFG